jgi:hypothetical protein
VDSPHSPGCNSYQCSCILELTEDIMLLKPRKVATQAITVKDFIPRGSERNVVVCVPRIWENMDQEQNVSELGFIVVEKLVPSEH